MHLAMGVRQSASLHPQRIINVNEWRADEASEDSREGNPAPAGMTTAVRSRARGSRAWFPSRVRERGPLAELTGVPLTPLRFVRCTSDRSSPRTPAMPDAGPLNAWSDRSGSTAAPVAHLRFTRCHVGRRGAGPHVLDGRLRCNRRTRQAGTSAAALRRPNTGQRVRQSSHRAPPSCAPVLGEGDLVEVEVDRPGPD